jgi:shikimate dehydrogenase
MRSEGAKNGGTDTPLFGLPLPLTGRTALHAILGDPIAQAGSPALFNAAFRKRGWPAVLVPMHVTSQDFVTVLAGLRRITNLRGLVLTTPHKTAALGHVDSLGPQARLVQSINAIRCDPDGRWHGEIFDGLGCVAGLRAACHELGGRKVLVVGTGGAGRAVAAAVACQSPALLRLHDVDVSRAEATRAGLALAFAGLAVETGPADPAGFSVVINCTPLGMANIPGMAIDPARLAARTLVVDLVIEPEMTALLSAAAAKGCLIQPGRHTLEGQVDPVCAFLEGAGDG